MSHQDVVNVCHLLGDELPFDVLGADLGAYLTLDTSVSPAVVLNHSDVPAANQ